ncbi:glycerol kinase GlpK [Paraferrimonas sp. SM1919]|uniref:glycerol kinase GlpK n=1 Tax=Paraferrimonas sp. SM1919 TaxID=2662263 RepID=UPI0013D3660C|nr:glycerol kinase GlpK [Paraferrimonas sp. SM1919]
MSIAIAVDQGTTSSRAIAFKADGTIVASHSQPLACHYPHPGWVEQDANELWQGQRHCLQFLVENHDLDGQQQFSVGITNQRETTIIWDATTGIPIGPAIVWQCRRSASYCDALDFKQKLMIREKTGLVADAYFSATKIRWLLDNIEGAQALAEQGQLRFGTVDTWLMWNLSDGQSHITDATNASRTMLYNIHQHCWDNELLALFNIPASLLPEVVASGGLHCTFEHQGKQLQFGAIIGDQQAALYGQECTEAGLAKNTYGTGCFMLMHTGNQAIESNHGLLTTVALNSDGSNGYALEGSVFMAGATMQWLRDELGIIADLQESSEIAAGLESNLGVYLIPAFTGMGAPHWQQDCSASIVGLTRGSNKNHLIRAGLESIAHQSADVIAAMTNDLHSVIKTLKVDGGASNNEFLMQFQADLLDCQVIKPYVSEITAFGAAKLAALSLGQWQSEQINIEINNRYQPKLDAVKVRTLRHEWLRALQHCLNY